MPGGIMRSFALGKAFLVFVLAFWVVSTPVLMVFGQEKGVAQAFYVKGIAGYGMYHINVIALEDNTKVEIWNLEKVEKVVGQSLGKMQVMKYSSDREWYYKIVADKPVIVSMWGGPDAAGEATGHGVWDTSGSGWATYFPSTSGSYVGKEFIFTMGPSILDVFAYEDSQVTLYDDKGNILNYIMLPAGGHGSLGRTSSGLLDVGVMGTRLYASYLPTTWGDGKPHVYRVVSTGKISLAQWGSSGQAAFVPSETGSFVGRRFLGFVVANNDLRFDVDLWENQGIFKVRRFYSGSAFIVSAFEDASVKVYDADSKVLLYSKSMKAGEHWMETNITLLDPAYRPSHPKWNPPGPPGPLGFPRAPYGVRYLTFESTGDISVVVGDCSRAGTEMGDDITFAPGKMGKRGYEYYFKVNSEAVIFAPVDCKVRVNDQEKSMAADSYWKLGPGSYSVFSDHQVVIQLFYMGGVGIVNYGTTLISNPDVKPEAPSRGIPLLHIAIGVVVAGVAAATAFWFLKRKSPRIS